jgi:hypothetical protein
MIGYGTASSNFIKSNIEHSFDMIKNNSGLASTKDTQFWNP